MTKEVIKQTEGYILKQYNITDAAIATLEQKYKPLKINGIDDTKGYNAVRAARIDIKTRRIDVEKIRKSLKEESLRFGKAVDGEAKRIMLLLQPIEEHLSLQEKTIFEERLRIKDEADRKERERIQNRFKKLYEMGMIFDGFVYVYQSTFDGKKLEVSGEQITNLTDEDYESFCGSLGILKKADETRQIEHDQKKKEEEDRLTKITEEQQAESKRLAADREKIQKEQAEKEAELQAGKEKLEAEKRELSEKKLKEATEKLRLEEIEKAKKEAAEKAEMEAKAQVKREAEEKTEKERVVKMETELAEKLKPDNEKLLAIANSLSSFGMPILQHEQSHEILKKSWRHISRAILILRQGAEQ